MIKFTIVTVTYNAEAVIERTLDSVRHQEYTAVEHIIVDGASRDKTMEMVRRYEGWSAKDETEHEVVVISEPDKGLYYAMNKGLDRATGDYIVFLNAGDVLPNDDTLETIADSIGDDEDLPGVLYGDTDVVDNDGTFIAHRHLTPPDDLSWRSFQRGMLVCHQAFYVRVDIADNIPYNTNYRFSADVDWCIRVMKACEEKSLKLKRVNAVLCDYLAGGMSIKNHRKSLIERFKIMQKHYGLMTTIIRHISFLFR